MKMNKTDIKIQRATSDVSLCVYDIMERYDLTTENMLVCLALISETITKIQNQTNKCPYGGTFGVDGDTLHNCDICTIWNDCLDVSERLPKKRKK
jgi:hypothetical protein